jgi:hypothetical protein
MWLLDPTEQLSTGPAGARPKGVFGRHWCWRFMSRNYALQVADTRLCVRNAAGDLEPVPCADGRVIVLSGVNGKVRRGAIAGPMPDLPNSDRSG